MTPSPFSRLASATVAGLVSTLAQTFAGVKTFASLIIASAGVQLNLNFKLHSADGDLLRLDRAGAIKAEWNAGVRGYVAESTFDVRGHAGSLASDVAVKVGTTLADASVNSAAKLLSVRTGLGATEVEHFYASKGLTVIPQNLRVVNQFECQGSQFFAGAFYRRGTDMSGTPGNATVNLSCGKSAIASGATTCTITSSYCVAAARVMITWHGDHGAARSWVVVNAGNFVVTLSAAASANASFSWEIDYLY